MARVVPPADEDAGLAVMLAGLVEAAVVEPRRAALLDRMRGTVRIDVPDAEVRVGLTFADGTCRVTADPATVADLRLTLPSATLLDLPSTPLLAGLPSPLDARGRALARDVLLRRVRIGGVRHVLLLQQLTRLLSVA